ncbi:hypothetical protein C2845_PM11G02970 [Panicum miliaceum]|uniref:Uncharacterized protein n=1 Tax=Panicum miliaceum TaxID=4540 RepID=A0A3L6RTA2_PANMI|nr:hypothetical protein C2845_PM11G02970 [Panicum miliaceum]
MRPGSPQFSVGDFIWQEIKKVSENPQKICNYSRYIMYMIKKTTGINFPSDVSHKPLRPPVSKTPRIPSPPAAADFLVGMCKSQRDIEVEQKRQWRASKKERDSTKMMHNSMNLQPPHSPISPTPPEVEVPSVEA